MTNCILSCTLFHAVVYNSKLQSSLEVNLNGCYGRGRGKQAKAIFSIEEPEDIIQAEIGRLIAAVCKHFMLEISPEAGRNSHNGIIMRPYVNICKYFETQIILAPI